MSLPFSLFFLPDSVGSRQTFRDHWDVLPDDPSLEIITTPSDLESRLKSSTREIMVDLGVADLLRPEVARDFTKSQRLLECCPYSIRLVVDLRPYVFGPVRNCEDLDAWDAAGKQIAWRLAAHRFPSLLLWEKGFEDSFKALAVLKESLELWSGPDLIYHHENKPQDGGRPHISRLKQLLGFQ